MKKRLIFVICLFVFLTGFIIQNKAVKGLNKEYKNKVVDEHKDNTLNAQKKTKSENEGSRVELLNNDSKNIYYTGKAVVLTYHHISREPFSAITIKPERFEEDLKMLKDSGFNVISLKYLVKGMNGEVKIPNNAVVITFDDGIESFYKYAYPVLKKYKMPAVNFIITSRTEAYAPSPEDFNPLSRDEIREMYDSGLVDIGSHTHNSHDLVYKNAELKTGGKLANKIYNKDRKSFESEESYIKRITEDLKTSREIIKNYTGEESDTLCFPFGHYNSKVVSAGEKVGFNHFVTTVYGNNKENSKSKYILRLRAGEVRITTEQLKKNIIDCANYVKK